MDFGFNQEQQKFIDEIRQFCAVTPKGDLSNPDEVPDDARHNFSLSFYQKLCDKGWAGITFPKEYGGQGFGNTYPGHF